MKASKIFLLFAVLAFAYTGVKAQSAKKLPTVIGDTIVNTAVVTKKFTVTGGYSGVTITVDAKIISGTGAGTIVLSGTNSSATNAVYTAIGSSYTITNVSPNAITFYITNPVPQYLKLTCTGSGTEVTALFFYWRLPLYQAH